MLGMAMLALQVEAYYIVQQWLALLLSLLQLLCNVCALYELVAEIYLFERRAKTPMKERNLPFRLKARSNTI